MGFRKGLLGRVVVKDEMQFPAMHGPRDAGDATSQGRRRPGQDRSTIARMNLFPQNVLTTWKNNQGRIWRIQFTANAISATASG
jgi:hypothetical protein